jgi:protein-S-isoprenylcysteine O-methyltransferase Ste14
MTKTRKIRIVAANLLLFWAVLPALIFAAGRCLDMITGLPVLPSWARYAGILLVPPGLYLCFRSMLLLTSRGRGLPISALGPTRLVTEGPYSVFRHPIYTGYAYCAAGAGLLCGSAGIVLAALLFTVIWFNTWVRLYEEPVLYRRFGADYRAYRKKTTLVLPFRIRTLVRRVLLGLFSFFFPVTVEGRANVPETGPMIFVTDHLSYFDFMLGHYLHPSLTVIPVSAEVFRKPLQRLFMGMIMEGVPKRRFCRDEAANQAVIDEIRAGGIVGIAVEGERSWTGEMSLPRPSVARNLLRFECPLVPAAFTGSYRLWPRWAGTADRSARVVIRIGAPFYLNREVADTSRDRASAAARIMMNKIGDLRSPDEASVDITRYPCARPELALWRCPVCKGESCLSFNDARWLSCADCGARWDARGGDLTLVGPQARAGERKTLAAWAREAGTGVSIPKAKNRPMLTAAAELREDPDAPIALLPLRSSGTGTAELFRDTLVWRQGTERKEYLVSEMHSVTTERNDTLQIGTGQGVLQLVFQKASPLQWQTYLTSLARAAGDGSEVDE